FYSEFALTDAVLAPLGLTWLLLAHLWLTGTTSRTRMLGAIGSGSAAGFMYAVHVRGTVVVTVQLMLALVVWRLRRSPVRLMLASVAGAVAAAAVDPALKLSIRGAISTWGNSPKSQTVDAFSTLPGLLRMLAGADGQIWY